MVILSVLSPFSSVTRCDRHLLGTFQFKYPSSLSCSLRPHHFPKRRVPWCHWHRAGELKHCKKNTDRLCSNLGLTLQYYARHLFAYILKHTSFLFTLIPREPFRCFSHYPRKSITAHDSRISARFFISRSALIEQIINHKTNNENGILSAT